MAESSKWVKHNLSLSLEGILRKPCHLVINGLFAWGKSINIRPTNPFKCKLAKIVAEFQRSLSLSVGDVSLRCWRSAKESTLASTN
mmetsp:Transcript_28260/g.50441  ORF Transcript_28260/g.50441 Transcript_28260/m.50441 type:complete len:86 (-) Transcript_28260:37-294(-)